MYDKTQFQVSKFLDISFCSYSLCLWISFVCDIVSNNRHFSVSILKL